MAKNDNAAQRTDAEIKADIEKHGAEIGRLETLQLRAAEGSDRAEFDKLTARLAVANANLKFSEGQLRGRASENEKERYRLQELKTREHVRERELLIERLRTECSDADALMIQLAAAFGKVWKTAMSLQKIETTEKSRLVSNLLRVRRGSSLSALAFAGLGEFCEELHQRVKARMPLSASIFEALRAHE